MKRFFTIFLSLFFLWLGAGCASASGDGSAPETDPMYDAAPPGGWSLSELENTLGGKDPLEPFNRCMFVVNEVIMEYIVEYLGCLYCSILPKPLIDMINNACLNLEYPARLVSCLLSAEWRGAGDETIRFFANSIIGLGGLFDVGKAWFKIYSTESDFGQSFAAWGIGPGCTLILPCSPRINIRDTVGLIFDSAFDGKTYIPYAGSATAMNRLVIAHRSYKQIIDGASDKYKTFRQLMLLYRELMLRKYFYRTRTAAAAAPPEIPPPEDLAPPPAPAGSRSRWHGMTNYYPVSPVNDSLRLLFFAPRQNDDFWWHRLSLWNRDFISQGSRRRIRLEEDRPKALWYFWRAPEVPEGEEPPPERLAIVVPGIGGLCDGRNPLGLAELLQQNGFAVVTVDSAFAWRLMTAAGNRRLPGFLPDDVAVLRNLIERILDDLRRREEIRDPRITLVGYSMGGFHTLALALRDPAFDGARIDRFVAINPPVSLRGAMERVDAFAAVSARWIRGGALERLIDVGGKEMTALETTLPPYDPLSMEPTLRYRLRIEREEAAAAVGLYLRASLRELLYTACAERPLAGVSTPYSWGRRNGLYLELDRMSFGDYAEKVLAKEYPQLPKEELYRASDLRSFAAGLAGNERVRVLHTWDDPLLSAEDRMFLELTFGKRLLWFSNGGHLGNLYTAAVQQAIVSAATTPAPPKKPESPAPAAAAAATR